MISAVNVVITGGLLSGGNWTVSHDWTSASGKVVADTVKLNMAGDGGILTDANTVFARLRISADITITPTTTIVEGLQVDAGQVLTITTSKMLTLRYYNGAPYYFKNYGTISGPGTFYISMYNTDKTITFGEWSSSYIYVNNGATTTNLKLTVVGNTVLNSKIQLQSATSPYLMTMIPSSNETFACDMVLYLAARGVVTTGTGLWSFRTIYQTGSLSAINQGGDISVKDYIQTAGSVAGNSDYDFNVAGNFYQTGGTTTNLNVIMTGHNNALKTTTADSFKTLQIDDETRLFSDVLVSDNLTLNAHVVQGNYAIKCTGTNKIIDISQSLTENVTISHKTTFSYGTKDLIVTPSLGTLNIKNLSLKNQIISSSTTGKINITVPTDIVVAMGDSFTSAAFIAQLDTNLGLAVTNVAIGGQTTAQMLARFAADVVALSPDYVWIMGGTDDFLLGGLTLAQSEQNLRDMYDMAIAAGAHVIAGTVLPNAAFDVYIRTNHDELNQYIRAQASSDITVVDTCDILISGICSLLPAYDDGGHTHLTAAGYKMMANYTYENGFKTAGTTNNIIESVASWHAYGTGGTSYDYSINGLDDTVGYKVYQNGTEILTQWPSHGTYLNFTAYGDGDFEIIIWDAYGPMFDLLPILMFIVILSTIIGAMAIFVGRVS